MKKILFALAAAVLCPLAAGAQTISSIGASNVKAANDFATRAFQDPWDMTERTDLGWFLNGTDQPQPNLSGVSFAGGVFSGVSSNADPSLFLLDTGNPFAARLGKVGTNFPIDASTYRYLALRMSLSSPGAMQFFWNRDTIYDQSLTQGTPAFTATAGYRIYLMDMAALPTALLQANSFPWGGTVQALRFDPTNASGVTVQLDWARLVSADTSLCRTIVWAPSSSTVNLYLTDTSNVNLGQLAVNVSNNTASPGCTASGSGYTYYAGALAPGSYKVGVSNSGLTAPVAFSGTTWVVNDIPTLDFTSPSSEGSNDDFATTVLQNPWDMNAVSDFDTMQFVTNPRIQALNLESPAGASLGMQNVFVGSSVGGPAAGFGDPQLGLLWRPGRGASARIDPTKYRILTVDMGYTNLARNINDGAIARMTWRVMGNQFESVTDDIHFRSRAGANVLDTVTLDMADRDVTAIEQGDPSGWVRGSDPNPGLDIFRLDPHEYTPATEFFVKRVKLAAFERTTGLYTINWAYHDSGSGSVDLYYDSDASGFDGTLIQNNINAATGTYTWNTAPVSLSRVFIYAVFHDNFAGGQNTNMVYAKWPVLLTNNAAPQLSVNRPVLNFGFVNDATRTSTQTVRVTVTGSGSRCWSVANSEPSVFTVTPQTGNGNGSFTVSLAAGVPAGTNGTASLVVRPCSGSPIENTETVRAALRWVAAPQVPVGAMETPGENQSVSGSIAVTGWAADDIDITAIGIYRDPSPGEGPNPIFIGNAVRVDDSRPDVQAFVPDSPFQYRTGWGYLLLTNFLPNSGTGTYRLLAYASDRDGHQILLGSRTIAGVNSTSLTPFGAIDTPGQGETISGASYNNFGWVLARGPRRADPPSGGSVQVFIDSAPVGSPAGWSSRSDLTALFPATIYPGVVNAQGVFTFNTTAYANGVHTIFWIVFNAGGTEGDGVGSRFFNIFNAGAGLVSTDQQANVIEAPAARGPVRALGMRASAAGLIDGARPVSLTRGYDDTRRTTIAAGPGGTRIVPVRATERVVIRMSDAVVPSGAGYEAYQVVDGRLRSLPIGSSFDERRGVFSWQPGLGFAGAFDLLFVRGDLTVPVRVLLDPNPPVRRAQNNAAFRFSFD